MFNFVYIMRDYTGYSDAFCANNKRILRYKKDEMLSAFLMRVASYISEGFDDYMPLSSWSVECNFEPIASLEFYGKDKYRCTLFGKDINVSDLEVNFLYCSLLAAGDVRKTA